MPSWFKAIWDRARNIQADVGRDFIVRRLAAPQGVADAPRAIAKDEEYVSITVRASRIVNSRKWTGKFYGAVHARSHYLHEDKGLIEYQTVLSPKLLKGLDPEHLDRVITINKPILGPVPYRGQLSLELGLFSVKGSDLAGPYIDMLTALATTAGVTFLAPALPFVEPFRKGLDLLFGNTGQADLEIGLDQGWNQIETGTWLVIRAPKGTAGVDALQIDPNDFGLLKEEQGEAYREQPYIVFSIEGTDRRDDWMTIPDLKQAWDAIGAAAKAGKQNEAEQLFNQFVLLTTWSPDLIPADANRLKEKAQARLPLLQRERAIAFAESDAHPLGAFQDLALYDVR
jgi:hypothetical protein